MCSIVASFDTDKLKDLVELNRYRGEHSHSISYLSIENMSILVQKKLGPIDIESINIPEGNYGICHSQAPTTDAQDTASIHPAQEGNSYLWHNGILKDTTVKRLQARYDTQETWDTALLLKVLESTGTPDNIDGTFSCLWYNATNFPRLYLFRNEISPMFIDDELNISSTKFEGSHSTNPNKILQVDLVSNYLTPKWGFKTVETPYFFFQDV